ncbi:hypothetical protein H072_7577 [Dactylellina haptotyla CBS 200.50]|uniref:Uncharacterized protein n=1 Tax=Dactylellina haptotyla (strain CBS 200.50) TaxID=1284197 RepID=S8BH27_DACHA|nr:hypothetical protein H072_7577 [Dactylellina haptotyla CBS 200.50]
MAQSWVGRAIQMGEGLWVWYEVAFLPSPSVSGIPPKHDPPAQYRFRVVRWVLLSVLAPELVLWAAWQQWSSAKILTTRINEILKEEGKQIENHEKDGIKRRDSFLRRRRHKWTHLHSFYVNMGGFVFDTEESTEEEMTFIPYHKRMTLSPEATILLAKCGYLPDIDRDDIKDKSKADGLAKVLVIMQAGWFLVQTLARLAQHLPVSLLEVNTIGHVLCALFVYILWWHKPREVGEPTVLYGDWVSPLCSLMYMSSRLSGARYRRGIRPPAWISPELENLVYFPPSQKSHGINRVDTSVTLNVEGENNSSSEHIEPLRTDDDEPRRVRIHPSATFHSTSPTVTNDEYGTFKTEIRRQDTTNTANRKRKLGWELDPESNDSDTHRQIRRSLCAEAYQTYPAVQAYFTPKPQAPQEYIMKPRQLLVPVAINWPSDFLIKQLSSQVVGVLLWFASIMYGSVHIAAWKEYFPTRVEQLIWHLSAGYIAASGVYWTVAHILFFYWRWLDDWWDRFIQLKNHRLHYVVYGFGMTCTGLLYIFCRAYLTIEGIVSLRAAPMSVYETVDWTRFIPHF